MHITAVLVKYETVTGRVNKGVATNFLAAQRPEGDPLPRVPIFIRKSQFRLPTKPDIPIIMIGPGTGLAPFRGFIQERDNCRREGQNVGDTILYFGCRKKSEDFLYQEVRTYIFFFWCFTSYLAFSDTTKNEFIFAGTRGIC